MMDCMGAIGGLLLSILLLLSSPFSCRRCLLLSLPTGSYTARWIGQFDNLPRGQLAVSARFGGHSIVLCEDLWHVLVLLTT